MSKRTRSAENKLVKGQLTTVRGVTCRIVRVWPFGTIDVVSLDAKRACRRAKRRRWCRTARRERFGK